MRGDVFFQLRRGRLIMARRNFMVKIRDAWVCRGLRVHARGDQQTQPGFNAAAHGAPHRVEPTPN